MKKVLILLFILSMSSIVGAQSSRKNKTTSSKVASTAGKALRNPKSTKREKSLAGSALTQAANKPRSRRHNR